ncbi:MAG: hypothetical protein AAF790_05355 [Planctomycetota bacterium]
MAAVIDPLQTLVASLAENGAQPIRSSCQLDTCLSCRRQLGWPVVAGDAWASPVECPGCGRWYYCRGRNQAGVKLTCSPGPAAVAASVGDDPAGAWGRHMLGRLVGRPVVSRECRKLVRYPIGRSIVVAPLDGDGRPLGEACVAMLTDLSIEGMRLSIAPVPGTQPTDTQPPHAELRDAELLLADLAPLGFVGMQAMSRIRWRGQGAAGEELGAEFIHPFGDPLPIANA